MYVHIHILTRNNTKPLKTYLYIWTFRMSLEIVLVIKMLCICSRDSGVN